ncbi:OmpA family protein [Faunimonas sp. B44]|uniref:OmpA family protein n=1 Tax=Faunimonas sp. B44 TaxID=3461493 RepID=UPI004043A9DE
MIAQEEVSPGSAEEGENYFVSMTDMMVGILFIFIIMLMVFALDFRTQTDVQENAIEIAKEIAQRLSELEEEVREQISSLDEAQDTRRRMLEDIQNQLASRGLHVQIDEAHGVLRLTEEAVRFPVNSTELGSQARANVETIALVLANVLPNYSACDSGLTDRRCSSSGLAFVETVFVEGHTDVTGNDERNWQLSTERAVNTYRALVTAAPSLRDLRNEKSEEVLSVSGYSSTRPINAAETKAAWEENRRIDLRFVMEVDNRKRLQQIMGLTDEMKIEIDRLVNASGDGS